MIPNLLLEYEAFTVRCGDFPGGVGAGLCVVGLAYLFVGGSLRRGLSTLNLGAIGALAGWMIAQRLHERFHVSPGLAAGAGAMVAMAAAYPFYRLAAAGSAAIVAAAGTAVLAAAVAHLPNGAAVVIVAMVGLGAATLPFIMEYKALATIYALEGSLLFLAGSFSAPEAFKVDSFPLYGTVLTSRIVLAVCVLLPMGIGLCAQLALYDPTIKERTPSG